MEIDVVDVSVGRTLDGGADTSALETANFLKAQALGPVIEIHYMGNAITHMVDRIEQAVQGMIASRQRFQNASSPYRDGSEAIRVLRIWGHADAAQQQLGAGMDNTTPMSQTWSGLNPRTVVDAAPVLRRLVPLFASDGRVELRGCNVGTPRVQQFHGFFSGTRVDDTDQTLLAPLAKLLGVAVYAQTTSQVMPHEQKSLAWGPAQVKIATPDGKVRMGPPPSP
jgi:hypothetical protein